MDDSPILSDDDSVAWWKVVLSEGASFQTGFAVLRPDFVVFIPTKEATNVAKDQIGGLARSVAPIKLISFDGFQWDRSQDVDQTIASLWQSSSETFDDRIKHVAGQLGGCVWSRDDAVCSKRSGVPTGEKQNVHFGYESTQLVGAVKSRPAIDRMLENWRFGAPPLKPTVIKLSIIGAILSVIALIALILDGGPIVVGIWGGVAGLTWLGLGYAVWRHHFIYSRPD